MVSGADWVVDLAWTSICLTCTHSTNQLSRARETQFRQQHLYVVLRLGCMPVFASALESNLEIVKGNLEGPKEEERKRRGDQSMLTVVYKTMSEALKSRAFAFQKLFSTTAVIRVFHYLLKCLLKFKTGSRFEHNCLASLEAQLQSFGKSAIDTAPACTVINCQLAIGIAFKMQLASQSTLK